MEPAGQDEGRQPLVDRRISVVAAFEGSEDIAVARDLARSAAGPSPARSRIQTRTPTRASSPSSHAAAPGAGQGSEGRRHERRFGVQVRVSTGSTRLLLQGHGWGRRFNARNRHRRGIGRPSGQRRDNDRPDYRERQNALPPEKTYRSHTIATDLQSGDGGLSPPAALLARHASSSNALAVDSPRTLRVAPNATGP